MTKCKLIGLEWKVVKLREWILHFDLIFSIKKEEKKEGINKSFEGFPFEMFRSDIPL